MYLKVVLDSVNFTSIKIYFVMLLFFEESKDNELNTNSFLF